MKLLILGLLAIAVLSTASRRDCYWRWHSEARDRAAEARQEARQEARERAREFRAERHQEIRAWREQRDRIRQQIRDDIRAFRNDWSYTY